MKNQKIETKCIHAGYKAGNGEPQVMPIVQSTTYRYYNTQDVADLFNLDSGTPFYARLGSPTVSALEEKMASLEGGSAAIATSAGQAANLISILNIAEAGDHIISAGNIYGGTYNLFAVTLKKMGIETTFIDPGISKEEILAQAKPNTKAIFGESLGNPALAVLDFEKFTAAAKEMGVILIVDNTLATPFLCRPIELGADIVTHSTTKYSDGHATSVGGMVIESGKTDWSMNDKYPGMTEPDASYHGLQFSEKFGNMAFCVKLRGQMLRDLGCTMSPMNAFLTSQGLDTLHLRMERHSENALKVAQFLQNHPKVDWVKYPGLPGDEEYERAQKYLPKGASGVLAFGVKGGREAAEKLICSLELSSLVVHVGDIRTSVLHPASTTHRQLSEEAQLAGGITPSLIRVSVGIEAIEDIIEDFDQALDQVK